MSTSPQKIESLASKRLTLIFDYFWNNFWKLLRAYFEEKYPDRDIDELDFNDKVRFFEFESEKRSRSGSRDLEEDKRDMTIVDEDLTMTPSKELKKAQVWTVSAKPGQINKTEFSHACTIW